MDQYLINKRECCLHCRLAYAVRGHEGKTLKTSQIENLFEDAGGNKSSCLPNDHSRLASGIEWEDACAQHPGMFLPNIRDVNCRIHCCHSDYPLFYSYRNHKGDKPGRYKVAHILFYCDGTSASTFTQDALDSQADHMPRLGEKPVRLEIEAAWSQLGLNPESRRHDVLARAEELLERWHQDKHGGSVAKAAEEQRRLIAEACQVIMAFLEERERSADLGPIHDQSTFDGNKFLLHESGEEKDDFEILGIARDIPLNEVRKIVIELMKDWNEDEHRPFITFRQAEIRHRRYSDILTRLRNPEEFWRFNDRSKSGPSRRVGGKEEDEAVAKVAGPGFYSPTSDGIGHMPSKEECELIVEALKKCVRGGYRGQTLTFTQVASILDRDISHSNCTVNAKNNSFVAAACKMVSNVEIPDSRDFLFRPMIFFTWDPGSMLEDIVRSALQRDGHIEEDERDFEIFRKLENLRRSVAIWG